MKPLPEPAIWMIFAAIVILYFGSQFLGLKLLFDAGWMPEELLGLMLILLPPYLLATIFRKR